MSARPPVPAIRPWREPITGSSVAQQIIVGVDTHKDVHVAAAIDGHGRLLGHRSVATSEKGCSDLHQWALSLAPRVRYGVEGTGSYGAGLARFLQARAAPWWRSAVPTASCAGTAGSPTPSMPRLPRARCWQGHRTSRRRPVRLGRAAANPSHRTAFRHPSAHPDHQPDGRCGGRRFRRSPRPTAQPLAPSPDHPGRPLECERATPNDRRRGVSPACCAARRARCRRIGVAAPPVAGHNAGQTADRAVGRG